MCGPQWSSLAQESSGGSDPEEVYDPALTVTCSVLCERILAQVVLNTVIWGHGEPDPVAHTETFIHGSGMFIQCGSPQGLLL